MHPLEIKHLIESGLAGSKATISSPDGVHFSATVICAAFDGQTRLRKQQMIHATLGSRIDDGSIHALSIRAYTPDEWKSVSQDISHG